MAQKNIELLIKDLSCRIPYGVIVNVSGISNVKLTSVSWYGEVGVDDGSTYLYPISEIKPYLFPLSSMTDEQKKEYEGIIYKNIELHCERYYDVIDIDDFDCLIGFYHKYHLDYRGLIPMGLAKDATRLNIY